MKQQHWALTDGIEMILKAVTVRGVKSVEQSQENFTEFAYSKSMTISLVWLCKTRKKYAVIILV